MNASSPSAHCPTCWFENPDGFRYCGNCGTRLKPVSRAAEAPKARTEGSTEKRLLSVMFCDLVGFTELSEVLDLEELRQVVHTYQQTSVEVVERYGGTVAQYLGDGLLVYFGYPQAREDDAGRAAQAGLEVIEAVRRSGAGRKLSVRIGIHTGLAVIGEIGAGGHREQLALGQTPNVANRLQSMAEPDTVVVSEVTYGLIRSSVECTSIGVHSLKGVSQPMEVFRAVDVSDRTLDRFEVGAFDALPMVGRRSELARLEQEWARAALGAGRAVVIQGEAGIGKSRLVRALKDELEGAPHVLLEAQCWSTQANSAFAPAVELLERSKGRAGSEAESELIGLLEISAAGRPAAEISPERLRQRILAAWLGWIHEHAEDRPLLLTFEDVQWMDPSTRELLGALIGQCPQRPILVVLTCRPDFSVPWPQTVGLTCVELGNLDEEESAELLQAMPDAPRLPDAVVQNVVSKAGGIPLFLEELTRMLLDAGPLGSVDDIPTRLNELLLARLDQLGAEKELVQLASVIGRRFDRMVLEAIAAIDPVDLSRMLDHLVDRGLLRNDVDERFVFTQALVQDVAYKTLLKHQRQKYHRRIADTMALSLPAMSEKMPEIVAHHYTQGALDREAVSFWYRAGQQAVRRWANIEAMHHLEQGLRSLERLPASPARDYQELELRTIQGPAVMATRGFAAPEVGQVYDRSYALTTALRDEDHRFPVTWGLLRFYSVRGELQKARRLGSEVLAHVEGNPYQCMMIHGVLGSTIFQMGEIRSAYEHLSRAIELYESGTEIPKVFLYALHPGINCLGYGSYALWHLGKPDQAVRRIGEMLGIARAEDQDPLTLAFALCAAAVVHQFRREPERTVEYAAEAAALARREGLALAGALAMTLRGWALAEIEGATTGIEEIRDGLAAWVAAGTGIVQPHFLVLLADIYAKAERFDEAREVVDQALSIAEKAGEGYYQAELHRIDGELRLARDGADPRAEEAFRTAVAVAERQGSQSLALRAAVSLTRWWQNGGRRDEETYRLLAGRLAPFDEGFGTADLREARALLAAAPSATRPGART